MIEVRETEVEWRAVRAQGAGGQNVNKVSSAVHLRFDIRTSSLPEVVKRRLLRSGDSRLNADGILVIKAQRHRSQDKNRKEAMSRLNEAVAAASRVPRRRIPTRPTRAAKRKRLEAKKRRGALKRERGKKSFE